MSVARIGRELLLQYIPAGPSNYMNVTQALQICTQRPRQQHLIAGSLSARGEMGIEINPSRCFQSTDMWRQTSFPCPRHQY
jgi:hypothetical protein